MRHLHLFASLAALLVVAACGQQSETNTESSASVSKCPQANADGIIEIADGLTATIISRGYGRTAVAGDYADVHTTLWLYDAAAEDGRGTEIWTSGGDQPFQFRLDAGQVPRKTKMTRAPKTLFPDGRRQDERLYRCCLVY